MNIEKLTEQGLLDLKSSIDKKLNKIRQDEIDTLNIILNKNKFFNLLKKR
jgi:hypothetical protein